MIEKLAEELLQKYPPESLGESISLLQVLDIDWQKMGAWQRLKYASEVARRNGQEFDYQLCRHFSELFWAVDYGGAGLILEVLLGIPDVVDRFLDERGRAQDDWDGLYYLCYGLLPLDRTMLSDANREIYLYTEAGEGIQKSVHYRKLFQPLNRLQGRKPGDPLITRVKEQIRQLDTVPAFEKEMIDILLQDLEKPVGKE